MWEREACPFQPGIGWGGEMRRKQRGGILVLHPQPWVGRVDRNICPGVGERWELQKVREEGWAVPQRSGQGLLTFLPKHVLHCLPSPLPTPQFLYPSGAGPADGIASPSDLSFTTRESPKMCTWRSIPLHYQVIFRTSGLVTWLLFCGFQSALSKWSSKWRHHLALQFFLVLLFGLKLSSFHGSFE